jgi:hypothetical protein
MLRKIMRALFGAQIRIQHMLMPDAFRKTRRRRLDVDTVQHLMEENAIDAAPHPAQAERRRVPQFRDGEDPGAMKPLLGSRRLFCCGKSGRGDTGGV